MWFPLILNWRTGACGRVSIVRRSEKGQIRPLPKGAGLPSNGMAGSYSFPGAGNRAKQTKGRKGIQVFLQSGCLRWFLLSSISVKR